nr:hypothetical protein [Candidatus Kapabacteria bacterium]
MKLFCPKCHQEVPSSNINVSRDTGFCPYCETDFPIIEKRETIRISIGDTNPIDIKSTNLIPDNIHITIKKVDSFLFPVYN